MKTTHTHTGSCQACGRHQAVDNSKGTIAKHGYTTEWGYFNGTCPGSDHEPAQTSVEFTRTIIERCTNDAAKADKLADDLATGKVHPVECDSGEYVTDERGHYVRDARHYRVHRMVKWDDATETQRAGAVYSAIHGAERQAKSLRAHVEFLTREILPLPGTALFPVAKAVKFGPGTVVTLDGIEYRLVAERHSFRGVLTDYTVERTDGQPTTRRLASCVAIRKAIKAGAGA